MLLVVQWNRSALLLGEAFKLEPGLREKFQILYKARSSHRPTLLLQHQQGGIGWLAWR